MALGYVSVSQAPKVPGRCEELLSTIQNTRRADRKRFRRMTWRTSTRKGMIPVFASTRPVTVPRKVQHTPGLDLKLRVPNGDPRTVVPGFDRQLRNHSRTVVGLIMDRIPCLTAVRTISAAENRLSGRPWSTGSLAGQCDDKTVCGCQPIRMPASTLLMLGCSASSRANRARWTRLCGAVCTRTICLAFSSASSENRG